MQNVSMRVALVAHRHNETNLRLVQAAPAGVEMEIVPPSRTLGRLGPDDLSLIHI